MRLSEVKEITGLSRSTLYDKQNPHSSRYDATFPKRVKLGLRAVGWLKNDLDAWLNNMISQSSVSDRGQS